MSKKTVFLSDLHMGAGKTLDSDEFSYEWLPRAKADACSRFLETVHDDPEVEAVVLLGDIMDDNVCPLNRRPPLFEQILIADKNKNLVDGLRKIDGNPLKKLYYVRGNHDLTVTEAAMTRTFPHMTFCTDEKYQDGRLVAEHGHRFFMWCAPDERDENIFKPLPVGYFLSRIAATKQVRTGETKKSLIDILSFIYRKLGQLEEKTLVELVLKFAVDWAGLKQQDQILMNERVYTLDEVIANYRGVFPYWKDKFRKWGSLLGGLKSVDYIAFWASGLKGVRFLQEKNKVVIAGHSHTPIINRAYKDRDEIYANSGAWCEEKFHYIETEKDTVASQLIVRKKKWDGEKNKSKVCGSTFAVALS